MVEPVHHPVCVAVLGTGLEATVKHLSAPPPVRMEGHAPLLVCVLVTLHSGPEAHVKNRCALLNVRILVAALLPECVHVQLVGQEAGVQKALQLVHQAALLLHQVPLQPHQAPLHHRMQL